jgi:hypothetical protein
VVGSRTRARSSGVAIRFTGRPGPTLKQRMWSIAVEQPSRYWTSAPGRRVYDLAQFAKMCCPLDAPANAARIGLGCADPFARLRIVADADGFRLDRSGFVGAVFDSVGVGEDFVTRHVERGEPGFVAMWEHRGGEQRSRRRARWLDDNRARIHDAVG